MKKILLFIISLIFFSFLIFILGNYFLPWTEDYNVSLIEEKYIDPVVNDQPELILEEISEEIVDKADNEKIKVNLKSAYKIRFLYFPYLFKEQIVDYTNIFKSFLNSDLFEEKIDILKVEFHEDKYDVRWKMKDRSIKMYDPEASWLSESFSVMVHEFGHFVDLYFLEKEVFTDISDYYYDISWESTKVLKPWMMQRDFVSGYSMTNKYEDFAESFVYFILHNGDFLEKSKKSGILKQKYIFFTKYLFRNKEFIWTDFSNNNEVLEYYRDITKIEFSLKNFLEFLKK